MAVDRLPGGVREFASYLDGLLARLDQGGGWSGVFWQRDPDGMRACLDGREVPPWDVVEALLEDLSTAYGPAAAAAERERARALYRAALTAYDARPGARETLLDRLDVMLREQRYAAERHAELTRLLSTAADPDALRLDLAWAQDDHDRATARYTELRARLAELDRRGAAETGAVRRAGESRPGWVEDGGQGAAGRVALGGVPAAASGAGREGRSAEGEWRGERSGGEARPPWFGEGGGLEAAGRQQATAVPQRSTDADRAPHTSAPAPAPPGIRTAHSPQARMPEGSGARALHVPTPDTTAPTPPAPGVAAPAWEATPPARDVTTPPWQATLPDAAVPTREGTPPPVGLATPIRQADAPAPHTAPQTPQATPPSPRTQLPTGTPAPDPPAAAPAKPRKRRRGSARFAGMAGDGDAAEQVVLPPAAPPGVPEVSGRRTPRGARFAGGVQADEPAAAPVEVVDAEAGAAVAGVVERLARLRAEGRSGEAHVLLVEVVQWPAERFPALADALQRAGLGADWATLLWEGASLPAERLVAAADALAAAGREADGRELLRQGVARPAEQIGAAVLRLEGEGRRREAEALLDAWVRVRTAEDAARSVVPDPPRLVPLLLRAARAVSDERHWDLVHALRVAGHAT
ncbi:hypothetical protein AB0M41_24570 [Streptomyces sp. NPDC051896]|uniref:hypothetical protein n=1 Tax=Streptomyces sp. NPDC051896 TaxID=3155416 RepID=UPI0034318F0E